MAGQNTEGTMRFTLRTLLGLVTLATVAAGWVAWNLREYEMESQLEQDVAHHIEKLGGICRMSTLAPKWLTLIPRCLSPQTDQRVTSVVIPLESDDPAYHMSIIQLLEKLKHLRSVTLFADTPALGGASIGQHWIDIDDLESVLPGVRIMVSIG